jgi:hypothetical protein
MFATASMVSLLSVLYRYVRNLQVTILPLERSAANREAECNVSPITSEDLTRANSLFWRRLPQVSKNVSQMSGLCHLMI